MSEIREQIADIIAHHCVEFIAIPLTAEDTHEYIADRILALIGERAEPGYVVKQFGNALSAKALRDYLVDECKLLQVEVEPAGRADPQDCPTCRALIEATMREMDKPETEPTVPAYRIPGQPANGRSGRTRHHGWDVLVNVTCVECPNCAFVMDYDHEDGRGGYTCPNCAPVDPPERVSKQDKPLEEFEELAAPTCPACDGPVRVRMSPEGCHHYEAVRPNVERVSEASALRGCNVCGGALVTIRPRYPRGEHREVCPTCLQERTEMAIETLSPSTYIARRALEDTKGDRDED